MRHFVTSFLRQFFENCKNENDMGRLEVVMHSEIQGFFRHCHCMHFYGVNFADLFKNV